MKLDGEQVLARYAAGERDFSGIAPPHKFFLRKATLDEIDLSGATLVGAELQRSSFRRAQAVGAHLLHASLADARFDGADLSEVQLRYATGYETQFVEARLVNADLRNGNFRGANFSRADLSGAKLQATNLRDVDLTGACLAGVRLTKATVLTGCQVDRVTVERSAWGEDEIGSWRERGALIS